MPRINNRNPNTNHLRSRRGGSLLDLSVETQKEILVIFLLAISAFCLLSFFNLAGNVGLYFAGSLKALFGLDYFLFPFLLILIVLVIIFPEYLAFKIKNVIGLAFFLLSLNGLLHLIFARHGITTEIESGGGYFGLLLSYPLLQWLRFPSAVLTLSAMLLVSFILAFNTSIKNILKPFALILLLIFRLFSRLFSPKPKFRSEFPQTAFGGSFATKGVEKSIEEEKDSREAQKGLPSKIAPRIPSKRVEIPLDLLIQKTDKPSAGDIKAHSEKISRTLLNFGIAVEMGPICVGPTVTQYTLKPAEGVKLSRITALSNDLALALAAHPIRIEAPIPGKSLVGVEVPNESIATVHIKEILESQEFKNKKTNLTVILGKDVAGNAWVADLGKMPHLLVAGATGSGKTVSLNSIIISLLYQNSAADLRLILIDPKRVELPVYNGIPHLFTPVVTEVTKTVNALKWAIGEMDRRFELLSQEGARDIDAYNRKIANPPSSPRNGDYGVASKMPYVVIVIDELADLMVAAGSEVEACIIRLAQMARAVGIHLIVATQRPSVDVITGLIKANITSRIAFAVASQTDSRTILDCAGAEKLLGRGDMLFITSELSKPKRLQGALVTDEEIKNVVDFVKTNSEKPAYDESITERRMGGHFAVGDMTLSDDDPLLPEAKDVIMRAGKASASLLQRRLKVGYARAARLLDLLEEQGIIGPADGAKPREIFVPLPQEILPETEDDDFKEETNESS